MEASIDVLGPGQRLFIFITFSTLILFLIVFALNTRKKIEYKSSDGSIFKTKKDCKEYEIISQALKPIYEDINYDATNIRIKGLNTSFIKLLRTRGFENIKIVIDNSSDFIKLADILRSKDKDPKKNE